MVKEGSITEGSIAEVEIATKYGSKEFLIEKGVKLQHVYVESYFIKVPCNNEHCYYHGQRAKLAAFNDTKACEEFNKFQEWFKRNVRSEFFVCNPQSPKLFKVISIEVIVPTHAK